MESPAREAFRERAADGADARDRHTATDRDPARLTAVVVEARCLSVGDVARLPQAPPLALAWAPRRRDDERHLAAGATPDPDEWSFVGWGTAARIDASGSDRFAEVRARAARLFDRIDGAGALPIAPRLFGGFAFDSAHGDAGGDPSNIAASSTAGAASPTAGATSPTAAAHTGGASPCTNATHPCTNAAPPAATASAAWSAFASASFRLPQFLYGTNGERAFLAAFVPEARARDTRHFLEDLRSVLDGHASALDRLDSPSIAEDRDGTLRERAYCDLVTRGLAEIDRATFEKVVLCRTRHLTFPTPLDPARAFAFLDARHPACARFLIGREDASFVGASPERLIAVRGLHAMTEALAGSIPREQAAASLAVESLAAERAALLASDKDRAEHAFVVAAIRAALAPSSDAIDLPSIPEVRSLAHVHHLATPITATLREPTHILDLAARLHPTPALCGSPRTAARDFILANEPDPRGWYGGLVGWFDARGDGSFAVAIRSALLASRDAFLYAGAGIVRGSDPARELAETAAKERAMRDALEAAS